MMASKFVTTQPPHTQNAQGDTFYYGQEVAMVSQEEVQLLAAQNNLRLRQLRQLQQEEWDADACLAMTTDGTKRAGSALWNRALVPAGKAVQQTGKWLFQKVNEHSSNYSSYASHPMIMDGQTYNHDDLSEQDNPNDPTIECKEDEEGYLTIDRLYKRTHNIDDSGDLTDDGSSDNDVVKNHPVKVRGKESRLLKQDIIELHVTLHELTETIDAFGKLLVSRFPVQVKQSKK